MADPVLIHTFEPGVRLVTGGELNRMIEAINTAFSEALASVPVSDAPNSIYGTDENGDQKVYPTNGVDGVVVADGNGKIAASLLPPLDHDSAEAASEAAMLALANISAPAICIRTDFTPAHVFYLHADPPSTLANWTDTGEFGGGAANPTATAGLTAKNGVLTSYMRSDGAPAIDQGIVPTWTGKHTFTNSGGTAFTNALAQTLVVTNTGTTGPTAIISTASAAGSGISTLRLQSTNASAGASIAFHSTALGTDLKTWDIYQGGTTLSFRTSDDANSTNATWLTATRAGNTIAGITSDSGSGQWGHTGNFSASGAVAGNTTVTAGIGSNSVQMVGAAGGQDVKIRALGVTDANVSIELSAKGTGLLKMASPTTVAGNLTVAGEVSAAQGAGSASPTNSGIALATAPNWSMAQFYDAARTANNRSMDILFISDGLHMRFVNDARTAFLDFLTVLGGQGTGVTGIASNSGSGSWAHTGAFSTTGAISAITGTDGNKAWLAKYSTGSGHSNAPTAIGATSTYLQIGGREYGNNGFGGIGFSYVSATTDHPAVWIGWEEKNVAGNTNGDFIIATRPTTTNVAPTERFRITAAGDAVFTNPVKTGGYTVATLPAASAALEGARAYVTDATGTPAFLAAVAGGGAVKAPVFCNGAAWVYG